jgi:NAD(P)-dependent dehydrogenase (short-subunit alcohol dehydrogenase family)
MQRIAKQVIMQTNLSGKRAFITGASSGFGAHFAKVLASSGATVVVAARRVHLLEALVSDVKASGGAAEAVKLDVADSASVRDAIAAAAPIDILVNNAGVTRPKPALELTEDDWNFVVDINLKGVWLVATEVARSMKAHSIAGSIINIASILGFRQGGDVSPYAISKAGVVQLTKQLALELARFNIRVNSIAPGYFATDLNQDFFGSEAGKRMINRIPQRRLGDLQDLDGPILLLASGASRFMTGAVITVDGGHLLSQL